VFLITHDIAEAVYLGDRIFILSNGPGTIVEQIAVPPASGDAAATQRTAEFASLVHEVSYKFEQVLPREKGKPAPPARRPPRVQLAPPEPGERLPAPRPGWSRARARPAPAWSPAPTVRPTCWSGPKARP
jgi:hypothetical protein